MMLQEMGLGPLWVRRERPTADETAPEANAAELPVAPLNSVITEPEIVVSPSSQLQVLTPQDKPFAEAAVPASLPVAAPSPMIEVEPVPASESGERRERIAAMDWQQLVEGIRSCTACDLCQTRTQAVPGVGDVEADWLVVGEAPGAEEDKQGEPFVGRAGQLLDNMLAAVGLKRGRGVYIANVLKCRPPNNRDPLPEEIAACRPWLQRQIELVQPRVMLGVGRHAANTLLGSDERVGQLRGTVHDVSGIPLVVTYHPAYLLRSPAEKARAWQDLLLARSTLGKLP